ncbi:hypothetical protein [Nocardioides mangrovi]|uniref:Response receiver domain-containing protein n=1 Tax=Nocardioides mangrovi TaxID=2874580 RepID=A0ABS7UI20_9ACTN|nr:hypothetical protein [Nocardioides mangrovi]MBZ5740665.1 hypothetical protein [Nocardioides mangrovi]
MTESVVEQPSLLDAARDAVAPVLDLLGIERVIGVDDQNMLDEGNDPYDADTVVAQLQSGMLPLADLVADSVLRAVFTDDDGEVVDLDEAVDIARGGDLPKPAQSRLAELSQLAEVDDDTPGQVDPVDVTDVSSRPALEAIFRDHGFESLTLAQWQATGSASLDQNGPTLVLVDRDFSREGGATDAGDRVVAELLARSDVDRTWCCLLTHSAQDEDDEEQLEREITAANDLQPGALVVLSKPQLDADPERFAIRLLGVLFRQHLSTMREVLGTALTAGHTAAAELLAKTTDFQLLSMFAAAIKEGVHEPDHVLRPLQAVARRAMSEAVRPADGTRDTLAPMHEALALNMGSSGLRPDDVSAIEALELFDSASFLSGTVQPIEPGDIFQIVNPDQVLLGKKPESRYHLILLAQPCDVMVRSDGSRGKNVSPYWLLARVKSFDPTKPADLKEQDRPENVVLPSFLDLKPRMIKLAEIVHVPVIALDMCAFDSHGYSRLKLGKLPPSRASWAWTKRYETLTAAVDEILQGAKTANLSRLKPTSAALLTKALTGCLDSPPDVPEKQVVSARIGIRRRTVAFGLKRIGHLNDAATRSLLVQATHHQGRPADEAALVIDPITGVPTAG